MQISDSVASMMRKKEPLSRHLWLVFFFFFKRIDRTEFSQEPEPVPSAAGVSEIAACPLSPVANDSSAPPSPTSSPSVGQ